MRSIVRGLFVMKNVPELAKDDKMYYRDFLLKQQEMMKALQKIFKQKQQNEKPDEKKQEDKQIEESQGEEKKQ